MILIEPKVYIYRTDACVNCLAVMYQFFIDVTYTYTHDNTKHDKIIIARILEKYIRKSKLRYDLTNFIYIKY